MSAYGHHMEREYSAGSLSSSSEGSDAERQFRTESVYYMSSFAASIFVGGLVIAAVLLMTLLVALIVMLQSCQNRSRGALEMLKSTNHNYDYCKMAALNAEFNNFDAFSLPENCKDVAVEYIKDGHYVIDLNTMALLVENYLNKATPVAGGRDVVVMDMDDILSSDSLYNPLSFRFDGYGCHDCVNEANHLKHIFLLQLYKKLQSGGWSLILISRKPEKLRETIIEHAIAAGYGGWSKLIMRSGEEMKMETDDYFSRQKRVIDAEGYQMKAVISSRMDAFGSRFMGTQIFKLPNPLFYANKDESVKRAV